MYSETDIHIGKLINTVFLSRGISIADFAKQLDCERPNIYNIFRRKSIDIELLIKISQILNFDFIKEVYINNKGFDIEINNPFKINYNFEVKPENYKQFINVIKKMEKAGIICLKDSPTSPKDSE